METKNVVANLSIGDNLSGSNYDIWHRIQYLLNKQDLLETLSSKMTRPKMAQHIHDLEAF